MTLLHPYMQLTRENCVCPAPDGVFPAENQCIKDYYLCVDNVPYVQVTLKITEHYLQRHDLKLFLTFSKPALSGRHNLRPCATEVRS